MAHDEPPHLDQCCLQIQLFLSLVLKELRETNVLEPHNDVPNKALQEKHTPILEMHIVNFPLIGS